MKPKNIKSDDEYLPFTPIIRLLTNLEDSLDSVLDVLDEPRNEWLKEKAVPPHKARRFFKKGDHIAAMRFCYTHHGIYDGHGRVYEYNRGKVASRTLESFSRGDLLYRINDSARYPPDEIIRRAKSRLGEANYHLLWNNCVNFATWCRSGNQEV